jgi:type IV fimbrial biogenesis protein FimT
VRVLLSKSKGFMLPELLVGLVIIAVLSAVAAPGVSAMIQSYKVKAAARQLASDLQFARMKAVTENTRYELVISTANAQYKIVRSDLAQSAKDAVSWRSVGEAGGVAVAKGFTGDLIVFTAIGEAVDSTNQVFGNDATITVRTTSTTPRTVSVAGNGRISIG